MESLTPLSPTRPVQDRYDNPSRFGRDQGRGASNTAEVTEVLPGSSAISVCFYGGVAQGRGTRNPERSDDSDRSASEPFLGRQ